MLADASAIRLRWLSEPAAWHPHWGLPASRAGKQLRTLLAVLSAPAAEDDDEFPDEQLPTVQRLVMQMTNAYDPATCQPDVLFRVALVSRSWAGWVRARLRSSAMAPFWIRMAVGMVRPGAVLHPELLSRHTLRDWLQLELPPPGPSPYPPPKIWLFAQRWAELFAHFCNVGSGEQCQWDGWARMDFEPYVGHEVGHEGEPCVPGGVDLDVDEDYDPFEGEPFVESVRNSISDFREFIEISGDDGSLSRTVARLQQSFNFPQAEFSLSDFSLVDVMRIFAALFPQRSDYDRATGNPDPDDEDDDEPAGTPVPCRWAESVSTLSPAEAAKVDTPWTRFPDRHFSPEELKDAFEALRGPLPWGVGDVFEMDGGPDTDL